MPILYSCISEGGASALIAEHPAGEYPQHANTVKAVLATVTPREYRRQSIQDQDNRVNVSFISNGDGKIVACVSTSDVRSRTVSAFLESIEAMVRGPGADLRNAAKMLQSKMDFANDPSNDRVSSIQESIDKAKDVLVDGIERVQARGDQLDEMHQKSSALQDQAAQFESKASDLKSAMCWKSYRYLCFGIIAVIVLILIILLATGVIGGGSDSKSDSK